MNKMERFVVIDLETTGHSPKKGDRIIEIGLVVIEEDKIVDTKTTFLYPETNIPAFISNLTGITDEDVENAPLFDEVAEKIVRIFDNSYVIAHNVAFDLGFLNAELERNGWGKLTNPVIDTVEMSRILFPQAPSFKLGQLAEYLHIEHHDPHRALSDAYVTAKLFLKLKEKLNQLPWETIHSLRSLEKMFTSDLDELLKKREEELQFSSSTNEDIEVFRGLAYRKMEIPKAAKDRRFPYSFGEFIDYIYSEGLQKLFDKYEKRMGQQEMSELIYDSFQSEQHALVEAETGIGKSIAYLLPAIYDAIQEDKRVVISTYTTQLQSQLLEEEIPLLEKIIDIPIHVSLLKGKYHYISLEKFHDELTNNQNNNYDVALSKAMILVWLTETETGDIDEIHLPSSGYLFYKRISTEAEGIRDPHSPWFHRSFYQKARKLAQQADIIITNHALLCSDMYNDYQFLPSYEKVIIDEAHHFETTASHQQGLKLDYRNVMYLLNQLGYSDEDKLTGSLISKYGLDKTEEIWRRWDELLNTAKYELDEFYHSLYQLALGREKNSPSYSDIGRLQFRLNEGKTNLYSAGHQEMAANLTYVFRDLILLLSIMKQNYSQLEPYDMDQIDGKIDALQQILDAIEQMFLAENDNIVKWIEIDTKSTQNAVFLYCEPTDISQILQKQFFQQKKSVVLTSATLTINQSFSYAVKSLGLTDETFATKKIESPFSYAEQVQVLVPNDFPNISSRNTDDFIYATAEAIISLAQITDGRMLVLFTSYEMLKNTYTIIKESVEVERFILIAQGITSGSRERLKKNFQSYEQAILFGTSSFWEGVDIPGEDLSSLVIVRLPFQPPDHPVYEAKAQYLKESGENPFMEFALPNAVIKFKQGFGRLIRSSQDRGIVFICDARIMTARYGKYFIRSIPDVPIHFDTTKNLMDKARSWF